MSEQASRHDDDTSNEQPPKAPMTCDPDVVCPTCHVAMLPEHAHYKCPKCHYRDSCCF